jgi:hypothetical protein
MHLSSAGATSHAAGGGPVRDVGNGKDGRGGKGGGGGKGGDMCPPSPFFISGSDSEGGEYFLHQHDEEEETPHPSLGRSAGAGAVPGKRAGGGPGPFERRGEGSNANNRRDSRSTTVSSSDSLNSLFSSSKFVILPVRAVSCVHRAHLCPSILPFPCLFPSFYPTQCFECYPLPLGRKQSPQTHDSPPCPP